MTTGDEADQDSLEPASGREQSSVGDAESVTDAAVPPVPDPSDDGDLPTPDADLPTPDEQEQYRRRMAKLARQHPIEEEKQPSQLRRRIIGVVIILFGLVLLSFLWAGYRAYEAYSNLQDAAAKVGELQAQVDDLKTVDPDIADVTLAQLQQFSGDAVSAVEDPIYRFWTLFPWFGTNLDAVSEVAHTVDDLSVKVMPGLVQVVRILDPAKLAPVDGAIDLAPIEQAAPVLVGADQAVHDALDRMQAIDRGGLLDRVNGAIDELIGKLGTAGDVTALGKRATTLIPPMMGADGPRTYLLVFQNLAELRATGGIFGSYLLVTADNGRISIADQEAASRSLGPFDPPISSGDPEIEAFYSDVIGRFPTSVNFSPDYPTAASLFQQMYTQQTGSLVDGVIATDPVALSYLLGATDGVDLGGGLRLDKSTAVKLLLSDVYQMFDSGDGQAERDRFLAMATGKAFSAVMTKVTDPAAALTAMSKAYDERRILMWSAHLAEQAELVQTNLAGALVTTADDPAQVGVFLNDGTGAKLDYYLRGAVAVSPGTCGQMVVDVQLTSKVPTTGLSDYVLGLQLGGAPYVARTNVVIAAPAGGAVLQASKDASPVGLGTGTDHGRQVAVLTVDLQPGQTVSLQFAVSLGTGVNPTFNSSGTIRPTVNVTPMAAPWKLSIADLPACQAAGG